MIASCGTWSPHADVNSKVKWTNLDIWNVSNLEGDTSKFIYMNNNAMVWMFDFARRELSFRFYGYCEGRLEVIMKAGESPVERNQGSLIVSLSQDEMERYIRNFNDFFDNPGEEVEIFSQEVYRLLKSEV